MGFLLFHTFSTCEIEEFTGDARGLVRPLGTPWYISSTIAIPESRAILHPTVEQLQLASTGILLVSDLIVQTKSGRTVNVLGYRSLLGPLFNLTLMSPCTYIYFP